LSALYIRRTGLIIFQYQFVGLVLPVMRNIHRMAMYTSLLLTSFIISSCVIMFILKLLLQFLT
jgi:hypothetical protein